MAKTSDLFGFTVDQDQNGFVVVRRAKSPKESEGSFEEVKQDLLRSLYQERMMIEFNIQAVSIQTEGSTHYLKVPDSRCLH